MTKTKTPITIAATTAKFSYLKGESDSEISPGSVCWAPNCGAVGEEVGWFSVGTGDVVCIEDGVEGSVVAGEGEVEGVAVTFKMGVCEG